MNRAVGWLHAGPRWRRNIRHWSKVSWGDVAAGAPVPVRGHDQVSDLRAQPGGPRKTSGRLGMRHTSEPVQAHFRPFGRVPDDASVLEVTGAVWSWILTSAPT
jgi:hypothetical protein